MTTTVLALSWIEWFGVFFVVFLVAAIGDALWRSRSTSRKAEELKAEKIAVGAYVCGFESTKYGKAGGIIKIKNVTCLITDAELVFVFGSTASELGRIPRSSVLDIFVDDRSLVAQRLTVPRIALLGPFSLAAPKRTTHPSFCLVIDWIDEHGARQNTIFNFEGIAAGTLARQAYSHLQGLIKLGGMSPQERTCPFCAETIKRAAIKCRFCGSDLDRANA